MESFDDIIGEFLVESYENLDQLDRDLIELEDCPNDRERLASVFRTVHTIKGTAGFLSFDKLERVAHVGENLLVPLRDGEIELCREIADGLLKMVDAIRDLLREIEDSGSEGQADYTSVIRQLELLHEVTAPTGKPTKQNSPAKPPRKNSKPSSKGARTKAEDSVVADQPEFSKPENESNKQATKKPSINETINNSPSPAKDRTGSVADSTVRIDVSLLDSLMNLVGELVLTRNQILQYSNTTEDAGIIAPSQRLNLITTELQEGVMKTRMQPIRNAWSKLPRVVRDLAGGCGKQVDVKMEGAETELDKTILEAIKDPLTHIVRNSVDHGIELPKDRVDAGKPATGTLYLRAFHEGGQVNIEIIDDGGGINVERVKNKAIEKGMISSQQAATMSEHELTNLILLPGFSTAKSVTNVSGRGVGMDVVKTNIERIGGTVEIQSTAGKGMTLRIKIPLTLAIVPALIVSSSGEQFAIPQVSLLELVRLEGDRADNAIEYIHDVPVYRLRGNLLPLVYLDEQLELRERRNRIGQEETVNIVVLRAEDRQFGLVVDAITDTQEIVVKPLSHQLKGLSTYAGATIMGDGNVALILDVFGVAQKSNVLSEHREQLNQDDSDSNENGDSTESLLIAEPEEGKRAAFRLSTVSRLEEFSRTEIERMDSYDVVQYRGKILPLLSLAPPSYSEFDVDDSPTHVIVHTFDTRQIGIDVGKIVDIVEVDSLDGLVDENLHNQLVIQGRVTELIDPQSFVESRNPFLLEEPCMA